ncbi:14906_t:CDS:2 [Rhizophagus irregularis]|nr:14906_t:CDS:2 [Rhizophagus irregularis]
MANISSSSFSSFEDSEYDESFLYDNFVEREDFSISFDSIENISKTEEIADNEEVQTRLISDVWKYFTRKEQVKVNQNGGEEIEKFILCNKTVTLESWSTQKHVFLANWVIDDQQPFTIVETPSFVKYISAIQPRHHGIL